MLTALLIFAITQATPQCQADSECTLRQPCSCECCPPWKAMTKAELEAERVRCAPLGPCRDPKCSREACPPKESFKAVCEEGRCVTRAAAKQKKP